MTTTIKSASENAIEAARLLGIYTGGRFDVWMLAGQSKSTCRQHIMSVLTNGTDGKKLPKSKCGVTAILAAFNAAVQPEGNCIAVRESNFIAWCRG